MNSSKSKINRSQKLVMLGRRDYQIKQLLCVPKYESTKGTSKEEQESLLQIINNVENIFGLKEKGKQLLQEEIVDERCTYISQSEEERESTKIYLITQEKLHEKDCRNIFDDGIQEANDIKQSQHDDSQIQSEEHEDIYGEKDLEDEISDPYSYSGSEYIPDSASQSDTSDENDQMFLVGPVLSDITSTKPESSDTNLPRDANEVNPCKYQTC